MSTPAEADLLVVLGTDRAEDQDWVMNLWRSMPAPKTRVLLTDAEQAATVLDDGLAALREGRTPREGHENHMGEDHRGHDAHGGGMSAADGDGDGNGDGDGRGEAEAPEGDADEPHGGREGHGGHDGHAYHEGHEGGGHEGHETAHGDEGHGEDSAHETHGGHEGHEAHSEHEGHGAHNSHSGHTGHEGHEAHAGHEGHKAHEAHSEHEGHGSHETNAGHDEHETQAEHHGPNSHASHAGHHSPPSHTGHDMHSAHHGHAGHDMGGLIAGLPMADRADDRDGLRLDQLHVPLGPGLVDWPAGLVLRLTLQGDVVQQVGVESAESTELTESTAPAPPPPPFWSEPWLRAVAGERVTRGEAARRLCAAHLDSLGRFFAVAGWADMAARARHVRDSALAGADAAELTALTRPLIRRAERSRALRWLTTGLGALPAEHAAHLGVTGPALLADGDAYSRMLVWLDAVARSAAACDDDTSTVGQADTIGPRGRVDTSTLPPSRPLLNALPTLLEGTEFAAARIVVASLDPDLDELAYVPAAGVAHG
ncbi:hypothetical protein [Streptomyces sp. V4I2]|uniref:hypothetical protein n=1 Tax=Streptomyces sp. V4I2 TaxID=3042280 RepID=UPI0027D8C5D7|nr:hypothetical protein [Streptomyces sp. V4I2]